MERLVFHEKFPVLGTLIFPGFSPVCRDFENFHKVPLCVGPVLCCGDFEIFSKLPCVWALYCGVGTLKFFKVPLCVGHVLRCGDFEIFQSSLCVGSKLCCGDFEIFQSSPVCGLCAVLWGL